MLSGALLGAGNIARNGHLPAYLENAAVRDRLRITAVADLCPENLQTVAALLPDARLYRDPAVLIREEQPDFVDVCTPPYAHRALIELAVRAGCHVLCEKPLATDLEEALAIRDRLAGSPTVLFPCHQYHYAPQWQAIRCAIERGAVGSIRLGLLSVQRTGANPGSSAWRPAWRTDRALAGGGILVDHGTHLFYQLHALFGPPATIACRTERRLPGCCVDDTATVYLRYDRRLIRIELTWAAFSRRSTHRYIGDRGEVLCLDDELRVRSSDGEQRIHFGVGLSGGSAHSEWFAPLLTEFADRIAARDFRTDRLDEAVTTAAYITRAYASAQRGCVALPWEEPIPAVLMDAFAAG